VTLSVIVEHESKKRHPFKPPTFEPHPYRGLCLAVFWTWARHHLYPRRWSDRTVGKGDDARAAGAARFQPRCQRAKWWFPRRSSWHCPGMGSRSRWPRESISYDADRRLLLVSRHPHTDRDGDRPRL